MNFHEGQLVSIRFVGRGGPQFDHKRLAHPDPLCIRFDVWVVDRVYSDRATLTHVMTGVQESVPTKYLTIVEDYEHNGLAVIRDRLVKYIK